jgi:predicted amidophosphoribosyltransferase
MLKSAAELLAPACCGFCGSVPAEGWRSVCVSCRDRLETERYAGCAQCAAVVASPVERCGGCLGRSDYPLRGVTGLFRYQGIGRDVVLRMKRDRVGVLASSLTEVWVERARGRANSDWVASIDLVTCIPQRPRFPWEAKNVGPGNMARGIGERLGKPVIENVLGVRKWMRRQHDLNVRQRLRNVRRAFRVRREQDIKGRAILVVDDVMTSGATLCSAAQTLLDAGASEVWGAIAARGQAFGAVETKKPVSHSSVRRSVP